VQVTVCSATSIDRSPRVMQVESMFDVPMADRQTLDATHELPLDDRPWNVGLIVGPSGSGKTMLARHAWPDLVTSQLDWPAERAIIDAFPDELETSDVVAMLGAVGLQTPPAWLRPHHALSNGEQFRASMARVLAEHPDLAVVDEFTSVVDRHIAHVVSLTVAKHVRRIDARFVAITCHFDVEEWLQPDWTYRPDVREFTWRSLQPRPRFDLVIAPVARTAWRAFAPHHYLSGQLLTASKCYGAWVEGEIVGFAAVVRQPHSKVKDLRRVHRIVVLPDWQGLGIAGRMFDAMGELYTAQHERLRAVTAHPATIATLRRSPCWRDVTRPVSFAVGPQAKMVAQHRDLRRLNTRTFQFIPPS
jgi:GNAT superfamily N-acetyltransferase